MRISRRSRRTFRIPFLGGWQGGAIKWPLGGGFREKRVRARKFLDRVLRRMIDENSTAFNVNDV